MSLTVKELRCENFSQPMGMDSKRPRLTWKAEAQERGDCQTAYRVLVGTTREHVLSKMADAFDSGVVKSGVFFCLYDGIELQSRTKYYWAVSVADSHGNWSAWSEVADFEMGLLEPELWEGRFLGAPCASNGVLLMRAHMQAGAGVVRARAYLAAAGFAELWMNGSCITQNVLEPVNSDYNKELYYVTYDITPNLLQGDNAVGVRLNNGWTDHGCFLLQIYVDYEDGSVQSFCSDCMDWVFAVSEIQLATQYAGESYNFFHEKPEWNLPGDAFERKYREEAFNIMSFWLPESEETAYPDQKRTIGAYYRAIEMPAPRGKLMATHQEPVKVGFEVKPVSVKKLESGVAVFDFGQNFTGVCKIRVKGKKGTVIKIEHTELLNDDGTPNMVYLRIAEPNYPFAMQTDTYMLRGTGEVEEFMPRFTYHGFRFAAVYGLEEEPTLEMLTGYTVNSDIRTIGTFHADDDMLTWMQKAIMWTEYGNLHSIPTDCPQRAERQGWLNDMTARSEGAVYNLDLHLLYAKWVRDIFGTQDPFSGAIADTAPFRRGNYPGDTVISSYLLVAELIYMHYGDDRTIREFYGGFKAWTDYLYRNSDHGIAIYTLYGDWAGPEPYSFNQSSPVSAITPGQYMSSGFNYFNAKLMAHFAAVVGNEEDKAYYTAQLPVIAQAINDKYFNADTAQYALGSQAANTFALYLGIVPEGYEARVAKNIADDIIAHDYHLTTGNLCTKYMPEMLSRYGYTDLALKLMHQTTYPSWGYMRSMGATTIWERWEYATGFAMNSHSHPMYGSVTAWFYKYLAGISVTAPGFESFAVHPYMPSELPAAGAKIDTPFGMLSSEWKKTENGYELTVTVPCSTQAEITLPGAASASVTESGELLWNGTAAEITGLSDAAACGEDLVLKAKAGTYCFCVKR